MADLAYLKAEISPTAAGDQLIIAGDQLIIWPKKGVTRQGGSSYLI
jgi:hypothetical protein